MRQHACMQTHIRIRAHTHMNTNTDTHLHLCMHTPHLHTLSHICICTDTPIRHTPHAHASTHCTLGCQSLPSTSTSMTGDASVKDDICL